MLVYIPWARQITAYVRSWSLDNLLGSGPYDFNGLDSFILFVSCGFLNLKISDSLLQRSFISLVGKILLFLRRD